MTYNIRGFKINNVPEYAIDDMKYKGYVMVARYVDEELWFYGTYPSEKGTIVANNIGGRILKAE